MSILSQKKDVFEQIAVLKTASELSLNNVQVKNDIFSAFKSSKVKNNKDPFLFIVDLLTILAGSTAVQKVISESFASLNKIESSYKTNLKMEITSANGGTNANSPMPDALKSGAKIHINKIDYYKELFTPQSSQANTLYLDSFKKNLINVIKTPNTTVNLNSSIKASYDNTTGFLTVTPINMNQTYTSFMSGLIDEVKFVDPKILFNQTLDGVFNTQSKSKTQIQLEQQIDLMLNKLMTQVEEDDSYFTFDTQELIDIEHAVNTSDKLYTEVGCGRVAVNMTMNDVVQITSAITFPVSRKVIDTAISNSVDLLTSSTQSPNLNQDDKQSVSNNFFSKFMNTLKNNLMRTFIASPQMNLIYALSQSFTPNSDVAFDPLNDIKQRKALTNCMLKKLMNSFLSSIFNLVKKELLEVVGAVAILYAQEGIEKYKKIITSFFKKI